MIDEKTQQALNRTVIFGNGKGGVGKTSLVSNLGGLAAASGLKVLLVDFDPQSNLGEDLGYTLRGHDQGESIFAGFASNQAPVPLKDVRPGLDVVPGGAHLRKIPQWIAVNNDPSLVENFAKSLAKIAKDYDLVLIDSPPIDAKLQEVALVASKYLVIPFRSDVSSRKGLSEISVAWEAAQEFNDELELLGVILFGSSLNAKATRASAIADVARDLGGQDLVFNSFIRYTESPAVQARASGKLIHELKAKADTQPSWIDRIKAKKENPEASIEPVVAASVGGLAGDYQAVLAELIDRIQTLEEGEG